VRSTGRIILVLGFGLLFSYFSAAAQSNDTLVKNIEISHKFGEQINIQAAIESTDQIKLISAHIHSEDNKIKLNAPMNLTLSGQISGSYDLELLPISPFSMLSIWFDVEMSDGTQFTSEISNYFYEDNRFQWETITTDEFIISWHQDNPDFGTEILEAAYQGLTRIQNLIDVPNPEDIHIYVYSNPGELQEALSFSESSTSWVAGHTKPDLKVVLVSIPSDDDQGPEIIRQIPHELTHVLLYEKIGDGYANIPRWLNEGLATTAEAYPNPEYQTILENMYSQKYLIPFADLCAAFPSDPGKIQLAYAEAYSFVSYIQREYGKDKIEDLIQSYSSDKDCSLGVIKAFNISLTDLETGWRQDTFKESSLTSKLREAVPLIIIVMFIFIVPIGLVGSKLIRKKKRESH